MKKLIDKTAFVTDGSRGIGGTSSENWYQKGQTLLLYTLIQQKERN